MAEKAPTIISMLRIQPCHTADCGKRRGVSITQGTTTHSTMSTAVMTREMRNQGLTLLEAPSGEAA